MALWGAEGARGSPSSHFPEGRAAQEYPWVTGVGTGEGKRQILLSYHYERASLVAQW